DDEIDLRTGDITINNGHIDKLETAGFLYHDDDDDDDRDNGSEDSDGCGLNETVALACLKEMRSLPPATDPLWQSPELPDMASLHLSHVQPQQGKAVPLLERKGSRHSGHTVHGIMSKRTRVRNPLSPGEVKLLVTLKKENATWDEVYSALPHRQYEVIRQWYRHLAWKADVPENWSVEDQEALDNLAASESEVSWEDVYSTFEGFSRRKLKDLWLKTCLSIAGLQPSANWRFLNEYGPGDGHVERTVAPQQTIRSHDDDFEAPTIPIFRSNAEKGGPEQANTELESPEPESSPDPAEPEHTSNQIDFPVEPIGEDDVPITIPIEMDDESTDHVGQLSPGTAQPQHSERYDEITSGHHDNSPSANQNDKDCQDTVIDLTMTPEPSMEKMTPAIEVIKRRKRGRPRKLDKARLSAVGLSKDQNNHGKRDVNTSEVEIAREMIEPTVEISQPSETAKPSIVDKRQQSPSDLSSCHNDRSHRGAQTGSLETADSDVDMVTPVTQPTGEIHQPRKRGRPRKVHKEQQPADDDFKVPNSDMAAPIVTPARADSKTPPSISTRTRSSRRASMPNTVPEVKHPRLRRQSTGTSAKKHARLAKIGAPETPSQPLKNRSTGGPLSDTKRRTSNRRGQLIKTNTTKSTPTQSLTPKTPIQALNDSDSDDPLSTPFTTVRPVYRKLTAYTSNSNLYLVNRAARPSVIAQS
ncbi:hypothetical protein KEM56_000179, partial [Ascosphaera pollenicola]